MSDITFAHARELEAMWKPDFHRYACALVDAGINSSDGMVSSDMVPDRYIPDDTTIPGCAVGALCSVGILESVTVPGINGERLHVTRRSRRPERNGAKVGLYRVVNVAAAKTFLGRWGWKLNAEKQEELALCAG